ncbi:MAG: hypothetical protein A2Z77_00485 [Chloroflexi bacterium RBG_13_51_36]|nr:MAG: hypothetical protein A2Z77_00485 [Chloroflexi bacterium RBG_13_51_36]
MRNDCVYLDSETVGFAGMAVLLQYAWEDGPVELFDVWLRPVRDTLSLIERLMDTTLVGFNLAFDHFHLCKLYTTFRLLEPDAIPAELDMLKVAQAEMEGRDGPCLKPRGAMDLMLHSRKGEHQALMSRHDIRIRKVPKDLSPLLKDELDARIILDPILNSYWTVQDRKNSKGVISTEFDDVVLRFRPDRGLKSLAKCCLGLDPEFHSFREIWPTRDKPLAELKYAPFAMSCNDPEWKVRDKNGKLKGYAWPAHIHNDIQHWSTNDEARRYGEYDVIYTRMLDAYFKYPPANDDDSILACMVGAVRWHGFKIDTEKTTELLQKSREMLAASPINVNKPTEVRDYIKEVMDPAEGLILDKSTKKANLEKIKDRFIVPAGEEPEPCTACLGAGCPRCRGTGQIGPGPMECSVRANRILEIKAAAKEADQHAKLLQAGRLHASFKVIGTLSSRMAGGDDLNAQGIKKSKDVRQAFPLAWNGMILCGGDFDSFEVTIADAVFQDPQMRKDLLAGLSVHTVMAQGIYPDKTFDEIAASKDHADGGLVDMYKNGKQAVFALMYGGDEGTINKKLAIKMKTAEAAFDNFQKRYPGVKRARDANLDRFGAMKQDGGLGTAITWHNPDDYCETFLGFRRYFTLENLICKELYDLAHNVPKNWHQGVYDETCGEFVQPTCTRRDRQQTLAGATCSAIYGAAFQLQAANTRAANNHLIQSPGAMITKALQVGLWEHQPPGVNEWHVAPMNIHDEVMVVIKPELADVVAETARRVVESFRDRVPLIALSWEKFKPNWGTKLDAGDPRWVHIRDVVFNDNVEVDKPAPGESVDDWMENDD